MAQNVTPLNDSQAILDVRASARVWIDAKGEVDPQQVTAGLHKSRFIPATSSAEYSLGPSSVLWLNFRFARVKGSQETWLLEFPQPLLDKATVYQRSASGAWFAQTAGDTVANSSWPLPGRYAQFRLDLPVYTEHEVFVRIQHVADISILAQVRAVSTQTERLQMEYLGLGIAFGALLMLIVGSVFQSCVYRDAVYGWYALYTALMTLLVAAWTGVAGHLIWSNSPYWSDLAPGCLGILATGSGLLVVHKLCGLGSRKPWFEYLVYGFGFAAVPVCVAYAALPRATGVLLIASYLVCMVLLAVNRAWMTWQRKDPLGLWVLAAFTPMIAAAFLLVATVRGVVAMSWFSQHMLLACFALEVPFLLIALNLRSRERHGVEARAQAMPTQDALTGLLTAHLFQDRLVQVVSRAKRYKEPAAVVYIELVNYSYIKKTWGVAVAEQSLLRSVIKLRRILRDVDTVGRIDEARFGLVLEGVTSRRPVIELAARLIAAGLMPLKGLKPDVVLQFHIAGVLLTERMGAASDLSQALGDLITSMGPRTRRQIRFLEPELTMPMELGAQSEFEPSDKKHPQKL